MTTTPNWTPLSRSRHAKAARRPYANYQHAATSTFSPVLMVELSKLNGLYPLAFVQQGRSYQLVALHGLQPGVNLYVNSQGQWQAPYIPAWHRSHPMRLLTNEDNGEQVLCVDEASSLYQSQTSADGERFFDDQGELSASMQGIFNFLQQCHHNRQITDTLVQQLADAGLIQPWALQVQAEGGTPITINGLFHINEAALQQLPGETLGRLAASSALGIAYAQLLSADRIAELLQRHQLRAQQQGQQSAAPDLDKLFGESGDGDTLKFGL